MALPGACPPCHSRQLLDRTYELDERGVHQQAENDMVLQVFKSGYRQE